MALSLRWLLLLISTFVAACASTPSKPVSNPPRIDGFEPFAVTDRAVVAVALGGGAARGFAHVGVLKALDDHGIEIDIVTGTSAGSIVGALYAGGFRGEALIAAAEELERDRVTDFVTSGLGVIAGIKLQRYVNELLGARPIQLLDKRFAAVATDLQSGEKVTFTAGNTGMAVRASSSVPGIFKPVEINGRFYVDGGLVSQVPVRAARDLGADVVIAVDVSRLPHQTKDLSNVFDVIRQSFLIMSKVVVDADLSDADVLVRPRVGTMSLVDFDDKQAAIEEGERAVREELENITQQIRRRSREKVLD